MSRNSLFQRLGVLCIGVLMPMMLSATLFKQAMFQGPNINALGTADLNGDGKADAFGADFHDRTLVGVALSIGAGFFDPAQTYVSGGWLVNSVVAADVNGDGKVDLIVSNDCISVTNCNTGLVGVLLGNGDGTFQSVQTYDPGGPFTATVAAGDVNNDGKVDIIAASSAVVGVLMGNGDGTFQAVHVGPLDLSANTIVAADVNGDGKLDLVGIAGQPGVSLGNVDGTFQAPQFYNSGGQTPVSLAAVDVNSDNNLDLIVSNKCHVDGNCNSGVITVLLSNGDGTFGTPQAYDTGAFDPRGQIIVADVDGDNKPDVLVPECTVHVRNCLHRNGNIRGGGRIGILVNNGNGSFQTAQITGTGIVDLMNITLGDVNGDGRPDILEGGGVKLHTGRIPAYETVTSSQNPAVLGQPITLTATVSSVEPAATGFVRFMNSKKCLGKIPLVDGVATLTTDRLPVGTLSIIAIYEPGPLWLKTFVVLTQVVNPPPEH
jgi:hypothetical protein